MNEFTYIYDGKTYTDTTPEFMATKLGMDEEAIESVLSVKAFELAQNVERRAAAYSKESDPLFLEALRKYMAGDEEGNQIAQQAGLAAVARIQARYPIN